MLGTQLPREGWAVRGRLGFLGHQPLLYRDLTARENLRFHARLHDVAPERIDTLLEAVGMSARADDPVHTFSRGMVQRTAVCRARPARAGAAAARRAARRPGPGRRAAVEPLISGGTRVVISHDVEHGLAEADLVLGLRGGRTALLERASDVTGGRRAGAVRMRIREAILEATGICALQQIGGGRP